MSADITEATDYLKFAAARALVCHTAFHASQGSGSPAAGVAVDNLRHLQIELSEAVVRLCPEGHHPEAWAARYDDGRPVISAMPLGERTGLYVHVWHPDRTHPMNNPGELEVVTTPDGNRKRIIVAAPGCIDAVTEASDGQSTPAAEDCRKS